MPHHPIEAFTPSRFESIRKQAKKLTRQFAAGDPDVLARVRSQLPAPVLPLSVRDAQRVLAWEYGFAGWKDLRAAVLRLEGKSPEWAVAEELLHGFVQPRPAPDHGIALRQEIAHGDHLHSVLDGRFHFAFDGRLAPRAD